MLGCARKRVGLFDGACNDASRVPLLQDASATHPSRSPPRARCGRVVFRGAQLVPPFVRSLDMLGRRFSLLAFVAVICSAVFVVLGCGAGSPSGSGDSGATETSTLPPPPLLSVGGA